MVGCREYGVVVLSICKICFCVSAIDCRVNSIVCTRSSNTELLWLSVIIGVHVHTCTFILCWSYKINCCMHTILNKSLTITKETLQI